jgi:hypothetical protein
LLFVIFFSRCDFRGERARSLREALHGALEGRTVGGIDNLGQPARELQRARREILVDRAARGR